MHYVIVIVIFKTEWRNLFTDAKKMTEIEQILNDTMALLNINNGNPLCHNDDLCCHQIIILLEVVNDAAPWF